MNVTIFDLDWYYHTTIMPNVDCMRLSSYHKQRGDKINFVTQDTHLTLPFDKMYITRENDNTPMPKRALLDDKRTVLLGRGFKMFGAKTLSPIVVACRPDYLLYPMNERNPYVNANFITFYAGNQLVKTRQDWHNTKQYHKKTIVTDKNFWKANDTDLLFCLEVLKNEKNVAFLEPISLRKILSNPIVHQKFLSLHFSRGTKFRWKNDYGQDVAAAQDILNFLVELRQVTSSDLGFVPFKAQTIQHSTKMDFNLDLLRLMQIIGLFKQHKIRCLVVPPKSALDTPYYVFLKTISSWLQIFPQLSLVEFITHNTCKKEGILWYEILNTPIKWKNSELDLLLSILTDAQWSNYRNLFFIQWGYEELPQKQVQYELINEYINLLYKDEL